MKLAIVLLLVAAAAAAPKNPIDQELLEFNYEALAAAAPESRNFLINQLIRQLIQFLRRFVANGSDLLGIPPLDPLVLDNIDLNIPAGIINLDLQLADVRVTGIGGFVVHRSDLNLRELSFDIDISVPKLNISAGQYDLTGDLLTAIPLYGKGRAEFFVEGFRFRAKLFLQQSTENRKATIIQRIENLSFQLPRFQSNLSGVIGGGDIDGIVNAVIDEVIIDYVNRFHGAISSIASRLAVTVLNPILNQVNTWPWLAPLIPRK